MPGDDSSHSVLSFFTEISLSHKTFSLRLVYSKCATCANTRLKTSYGSIPIPGSRLVYNISMIKRALIILVIIGVVVVIVLAVTNQAGFLPPPVLPQVFTSQTECESATGKKCSFSMCDYVPEGKTFEEVCGGVGKQWLPKK